MSNCPRLRIDAHGQLPGYRFALLRDDLPPDLASGVAARSAWGTAGGSGMDVHVRAARPHGGDQVGYNLAAEGPDAEAAVARRQGPVRVLAALRVLADPGADGGADVAFAAGAVLRLTRHFALAGDAASLTKRGPGEKIAWSAGLNLAIPHTPHTLSLHATNTNNATLQSSSRGIAKTRYGFEFTIPVTLSRYFGGGRPQPGPAVVPQAAAEPEANALAGRPDTVTAGVQDFLFRPARLEVTAGTTIVWINNGQVVHTVSAEDGSFDSGPIEPGARRGLTFSRAGTFPFHCTPHPFMRGVIVVR